MSFWNLRIALCALFLPCLVRMFLAIFWIVLPNVAMSASHVSCSVSWDGGGGICTHWWYANS